MPHYQTGIRNVKTGEIMALPTDDQGIEPLIDLDFVGIMANLYEVVRREVGPWTTVEEEEEVDYEYDID